MMYEKPSVNVINFNNDSSFMATSSGYNCSSKDQLISAASSAALAMYGGGNSQVVSANAYQVGGNWVVEVTVSNHGGQHRKTYRYDEVTGTCIQV